MTKLIAGAAILTLTAFACPTVDAKGNGAKSGGGSGFKGSSFKGTSTSFKGGQLTALGKSSGFANGTAKLGKGNGTGKGNGQGMGKQHVNGLNAKNGQSFKGKDGKTHHYHHCPQHLHHCCHYSGYCNWSSYCWFGNYGCCGYYCPTDCCWYYWYEPYCCYLPCTYMQTYCPVQCAERDDDDANDNGAGPAGVGSVGPAGYPAGATAVPAGVIPGKF